MPEQFSNQLLERLVAAHLPADPEGLTFNPIRTGKHNTSHYYEVQKYIVIHIWRRRDPAQALQYKRESFALARPLLEALGQPGS